MKLKELIKELQGYDIKVGANTCFLYCGKCNSNTPATISKVSDNLLKYLKEHQINQSHGTPNKSIIQCVKEFIPLLEREVIEIYDSCIHENEKIIRVTGLEKGKYWDKEEYQKARKSQPKEAVQTSVDNWYKLGTRNIYLASNVEEVLTQYVNGEIDSVEAYKTLGITRSMFFRVLNQEGTRKNVKKS